MEENQLDQFFGSTESKGCVNCGSAYALQEYPTPLCSDCRQLFIKFPIPLWVKLFGMGVSLVLVFALFSFPKNLSTGIHFEKGRKYEEKRQYKSAQREYMNVIHEAPYNLEANAHVMIAAFYNLDYTVFVKALDRVEGKNIDDNALYDRLDDMINRVKADVPDDSMGVILEKHNNDYELVPDSVFKTYLKSNPVNVYALYTYACKLFKQKDYAGCDSLLQRVLGVDAEHMTALRLLATTEREKGQWEESIKNFEKIIHLNNEAGYAYAGMARTYLKWNKLEKGLELAQKSMAINKEDSYNKATLAIAWHLNKQPLKRDEVLKEFKLHAGVADTAQLQYALDFINNKETL